MRDAAIHTHTHSDFLFVFHYTTATIAGDDGAFRFPLSSSSPLVRFTRPREHTEYFLFTNRKIVYEIIYTAPFLLIFIYIYFEYTVTCILIAADVFRHDHMSRELQDRLQRYLRMCVHVS